MQIPRSTARHRSVERLNGLADAEAIVELRACCASDAWAGAITAGRPYPSLEALLDASDVVVAGMDDAALEQALSAHPRIGERRIGAQREDDWSRTEQAAALGADAGLRAALAEGNRAYEERFDRVFLIRAAGRSAQDMCDALRSRLGNDEDTERAAVLHQLAEITRLRLTRLVSR